MSMDAQLHGLCLVPHCRTDTAEIAATAGLRSEEIPHMALFLYGMIAAGDLQRPINSLRAFTKEGKDRIGRTVRTTAPLR